MAFRLAAEAKATLEAGGFTFAKREEDGWWQMMNGDITVSTNKSLGDLIREQANKEGAW
jgi:hypothetical protein